MRETAVVFNSEEQYIEREGGILSDSKKLYYDGVLEGCELI